MRKLDARQLAREKWVFRYTSALERGDFATVAAVLAEAEHDPHLALMINEVNTVLEAELPKPVPSLIHSNNHHQEDHRMTTTVLYPPQPSAPLVAPRRLSFTLAAAVIAVGFFSLLMLTLRPGGSGPFNNALLQPATTETPTATPFATLVPSATPLPAVSGSVIVQSGGQSLDVRPAVNAIISITGTNAAVTVRAEPNDLAAPVTTLLNGSQVFVVAQTTDGGWTNVVLPEGGAGWVMTNMLTIQRPAGIPSDVASGSLTSLPICQAVIGPDSANLFSRPESSTILGSLPPGTPIIIMDAVIDTTNRNAWYFVQSQNTALWQQGWALNTLVLPGDACPQFSFGSLPGNTVIMLPTAVPPMGQSSAAPVMATPTSLFNMYFRSGQFIVQLIRDVDGQPAGTRVQILSGYFNGSEWIYQVTTDSGISLNIRESDLAMPEAGIGMGINSTVVPAAPASVIVQTVPYTVQPGDTLLSIAARFTIDLQTLAYLNPQLNLTACDPARPDGAVGCDVILQVGDTLIVSQSVMGSSVQAVGTLEAPVLVPLVITATPFPLAEPSLVPGALPAFTPTPVALCEFIVGDTPVPVRAQPSEAAVSLTIGILPAGTAGLVIRQQTTAGETNWYLIRADLGDEVSITGWVSSDNIQVETGCLPE